MADSFVLPREHNKAPAEKRRVLVTGAAGSIGSYFAVHAPDRYDLTLMIHPDEDEAPVRDHGEVVRGRLEDLDQIKSLFQGHDTILHLAASAAPDTTWEVALNTNITGTYNTFVAAIDAGCRRVVFASSIHAVSGYPADYQVHPDDPVNPGDLYGVSKCFGEAMARFAATQHGLSAIAIRIGGFTSAEGVSESGSVAMMDAFVARDDLNQLLCCAIDNEDIQFAIVHGLSRNRFNRMSITSARELLGYEPRYDITEIHPELQELHLRDEVMDHNEKGGQRSGLRNQLENG